MNHIFNKFDLTQKLLFFTLFFSILIVICILIPMQMIGKSLLQSNMERQLEISAKASGNNLQDFFDLKGNESKIIRKSPAVTRGLSEMREGFAILVREKGGEEKAREYLHKLYTQSNTQSSNPTQKNSITDTSLYGKAH